LNRSEAALSDEMHHSPPEPEAIAIILGGGVERISVGMERLRNLRERQLRAYVLTLESIAVDRLAGVNPGLVNLARPRAAATG
jgi:hypothetical protein